MIQYLYNNDIIIYTYAGLCGLGLLLRLIVNMVYKHLVKESDKLGETKNKMLKHVKMKFETCFKLKIGVNNVDTFVDKNVLKYRFCGVLLSTWDNICGQILFLNLLIVPILAVFGEIYECGQDQILFSGAVGISTSAFLILVDKSMNIVAKKKLLRLNLLDYLENFCKVRLEQEAIQPEIASQLRREFIQSSEVNKQISATLPASETIEVKDELNRRREARHKKEEERKLLAQRREEEQRRAEEARKEEEKRKLGEKKQAAARRREEERMKLEEEREALEARRAELKLKSLEKQQALELKKQKTVEKEEILHSLEDELKPSEDKSDIDMLMQGLEEIAAEKERSQNEKEEKKKSELDKLEKDGTDRENKLKATTVKAKSQAMSLQEEKLIEDVLKEFFA